MGIDEGTCWDEHWVLYGNQFDNKFHIKKKKERKWGKNHLFSWVKNNTFLDIPHTELLLNLVVTISPDQVLGFIF